MKNKLLVSSVILLVLIMMFAPSRTTIAGTKLVLSVTNGNTYWLDTDYPEDIHYLNNISPCKIGDQDGYCDSHHFEIFSCNGPESGCQPGHDSLQKDGNPVDNNQDSNPWMVYAGTTNRFHVSFYTYGFCVDASNCVGWYAGRVGWEDPTNNYLFSVNLSSAEVTYYGHLGVPYNVNGIAVSNGVPFCGGGGD